MNASLRFSVRSSSTDEVYVVSARREGPRLSILCTCMAGQNGTMCKHRTDLIDGVVAALVNDQKADVEMLARMLEGTPLAAGLVTLTALEQEAGAIKRRIAAQKKQVARMMFGH